MTTEYKKKYSTFLVVYADPEEALAIGNTIYVVRAVNSTQARSLVWREEEKMGNFKNYACRFATRDELNQYEEGYADYCDSIDMSIIV